MKKKTLIIISVISIFTAAFTNLSAQDYSDEKTKSSWYIGFGLGSGDGNWNVDGENVTFNEWSEGASDKMTITLNFGVGAILTPNFHLGGEISAISHQVTYDGYDCMVQINNYMLVGSYYPFETGFFVKGGAGISAMVVQIDTYSDNIKGYGALAGLGYNFWLGETFNLGLNCDFSYQKYSGESYEPSDSKFFSIYVSCYWF